jgi:hypothetical protein
MGRIGESSEEERAVRAFRVRTRTHSRDDLRLALLPPLGDLGVDLISQLGLDLPRVPWNISTGFNHHTDIFTHPQRARGTPEFGS